jgi:FtsH-binding integral membrane protein
LRSKTERARRSTQPLASMRSHLIFVAILIVSGSLFWFAKIMERAQRSLTPEHLKLLNSSNESPWSQFLIPIVPIVLGYILLSVFPQHQAWVAIPALLLAAAAMGLQYRAAARRTKTPELPAEYQVENRKAKAVLMGGVGIGMALIIWSQFE